MKNLTLFAVSLIFYGWGEPVYLTVMIFVLAVNYAFGKAIEKKQETGYSGKTELVISLIINLLVLSFFKYTGFIVKNLKLLPFLKDIHIPEISLPIGISFYIFQSMSYTIDVYRNDAACQKSFVKFGTYISMFPQLIAGPIVRYADIERQLDTRRESAKEFAFGIQLFIIGLSKKVLFANTIGLLWKQLLECSDALSAWAGMAAYTLQIYFDFSGYSDMAVGLGHMFGFTFPKNFDYPYISQSVTEFWRRWHISLSSWFREYVYYPLGGNRKGRSRQIMNLFIVWVLTGLWHGASWNFVLWGLYYAVFLTAEKTFLNPLLKKLPKIMRHIYLLMIVSIGWMIFYFEDLQDLSNFILRMFSFGMAGESTKNILLSYLPVLSAGIAAATPFPDRIFKKVSQEKTGDIFTILILTVLMLLCVSSLAAGSYNPFIYFRF